MKLYTAANLWRGEVCTISLPDGELCTSVQVSPLQQTQRFLGFEWQVDVDNPFEVVESYDPSGATEAYSALTLQLLDDEINIEYVAANLEAGALRAQALELEPSAFNLAAWHMWGVQTNWEIEQSGWNPGGAINIVDDMPTALTALGVASSWDVSQEPQYEHWKQWLQDYGN